MKNLKDLEKFINSELASKINNSFIKHDNIYLSIDHDELIEVITFLKTNNETKFIFSSSVYPGILITSILSRSGGKIFKVFAVVTNITSDKS